MTFFTNPSAVYNSPRHGHFDLTSHYLLYFSTGMWCFPRTLQSVYRRPIWCRRPSGGTWASSRARDGCITWSTSQVFLPCHHEQAAAKLYDHMCIRDSDVANDVNVLLKCIKCNVSFFFNHQQLLYIGMLQATVMFYSCHMLSRNKTIQSWSSVGVAPFLLWRCHTKPRPLFMFPQQESKLSQCDGSPHSVVFLFFFTSPLCLIQYLICWILYFKKMVLILKNNFLYLYAVHFLSEPHILLFRRPLPSQKA